jgi:transcriptional/translational regulatory protein YebC/TACO1
VHNYILTLRCPDGPGITHAITGALLSIGATILEQAQFTEPTTNQFCMRTRFETPNDDLAGVRAALEEAGIAFESADSTMVANLSVALETAEAAQAVLRLIDALEDNDDIQDVYSNFDIADELMQNLEL